MLWGDLASARAVHVSGYYRKNGTYVAPYWRRSPGSASISDGNGFFDPNSPLWSASTARGTRHTTTTFRSWIFGSKSIRVGGYFRNDGTYVRPYVRSAPGAAAEWHGSSAYYPKSSLRSGSTHITQSTESHGSTHVNGNAGPRSRGSLTGRSSRFGTPLIAFGFTREFGGQLSRTGERPTRSRAAKCAFLRNVGYGDCRVPQGFVVDHIQPLCSGGPDSPSNMQLQPIGESRMKDKQEVRSCRKK